MSPGPTFERVYRDLREQLVEGRFAPGSQLEPAALGEALCSSITPVRDALHRLVGERIVEAPHGDGFRVPLPTEYSVRSLYAWSGDLLRLVLARPGAALPSLPPLRSESPNHAAIESAELLARLAAAMGSPEHRLALANANARLGPVRAVEPQVLNGLAEEVRELHGLSGSGDVTAVRRGIKAYHRRRERAVPALVEALQSQMEPGARGSASR